MTLVAGFNKSNRPFFMTGVDGERVEFPAQAEGSGNLDGLELEKFNACVKAGLIEPEQADKPKRGRPRKES